MSAGYLVVAADSSSVTIEDHTKPLQKDRKLPTMNMTVDNRDGEFAVGDRVELALKKVAR